MKRKWLLPFIWGAGFLLFGLLGGCTGGAEEEATVQAVVEQLISTNTPTPAPSDTPTATHTAVPPTNTATPLPTDTPVPPTATPTPAALSLLAIEDETGDTFLCDTQAASEDSEVDIANVQASYRENALRMDIWMAAPLENDFSFAVLLAIGSNQNLTAYLWEVHDTVYRIGEMDYQTGELVAEPGTDLDIAHDLNLGQLQFTIPYSVTVPLTATATITQTAGSSQLFVSSFHTAVAGEAKHCDIAGPWSLPGAVQSAP